MSNYMNKEENGASGDSSMRYMLLNSRLGELGVYQQKDKRVLDDEEGGNTSLESKLRIVSSVVYNKLEGKFNRQLKLDKQRRYR